jgi:hypothetical protein
VLDKLLELLNDTDSEIRLNSIKLLSLLAEAPQGKKNLKSALEKVSWKKMVVPQVILVFLSSWKK